MIKKIALMLVLVSVFCSQAYAISDSDMDKMTSYAVMIGRAGACKIDTTDAMGKIARWSKTALGERDGYVLAIFAQGVDMAMKQQLNGSSPDSCYTVEKAFRTFPWPE